MIRLQQNDLVKILRTNLKTEPKSVSDYAAIHYSLLISFQPNLRLFCQDQAHILEYII